MELYRADVTFTGSVVGGGIAQMYFNPSGAFQSALKTFWTSLATIMAGQTTITVPAVGDIIESETGELVDVWAEGTVGTLTGGGSGAYAAGVGASIGWTTAGIVRGHRVRGRTFVVPLALNQFDGDGTLTAAANTALGNAAAALVGSSTAGFGIWTRPRLADPGATPPVTAAIGEFSAAVGHRITDRTGWLSSRKR